MQTRLANLAKERLLALPRRGKQLVVIVADVLAAWLAMWLAFTLRLEIWHCTHTAATVDLPGRACDFYPCLHSLRPISRDLPIHRVLPRCRRCSKRRSSMDVLLLTLVLVTFPAGVPRSVGVLQPILFLVLVSNSRAWARFWLNRGARRDLRHRLLIYGAGSAGAQTAAAVANGGEFELLGFVDDDAAQDRSSHQRQFLCSRRTSVEGYRGAARRLGHPTRAAVGFASAAPPDHRGAASLPVHIRTLPGMADLASGRVSISDFRELDLEDLLGPRSGPAELGAAGTRPCGQGRARDRRGRQHRFGALSPDPRGASGQAVARRAQ